MPKVPSVVVPQLSLKNYIHPLATVLIAWAIAANGFPQPPQMFRNLVQNELFQYFLVFVLVYQGGGRQDLGMSLMVTVGLFLLSKILDLRAFIGNMSNQAPPPPPPAPQVAQATPRPGMGKLPISVDGALPPTKEQFYYRA